MSRIGNNPISIPEGVSVNVNNNVITVNGKNGELSQVFDGVSFDISDNTILVKRNSESKDHKAKHGLYRSLVANMVTGVSSGFEKRLQITGVGYRAQLDGKDLVLNMGYSHPVKMITPSELAVKVESPTSVVVTGMQKDLVGEFAAKIRAVRPPEPYKGKGIAYEGEVIRRKAGKTGK